MFIYGSTAIQYWFPDFNRIPKDVDLISKDSGYKTLGLEVYWIDAFEYLEQNNVDDFYVDPNFLYTIKVSHLAWDINWEKHLKDAQFLKSKGCVLDKTFYDMLIASWKDIHKSKKISFNKRNKDLFEDSVKRKYNHDDVHEFLKLNDEPMYKKILVNPDYALCSEEKFIELSEDKKLELALEEVVVVAFERYVFNGYPFNIAIVKSLKDLITRMTKGWFNLYLIENSEKIIFMQEKYFNHFKTEGEKLC